MLHKNSVLANNHPIHAWRPANTAARLALVTTAVDIGKVAWQVDNGAFYALGAVGPNVWILMGETASGVAGQVNAAPSKTIPVDADAFAGLDSAVGNTLARFTWANIKAALLQYMRGEFREKLTAARSYYVRADGNDANTGLGNTAGTAFLTIQRAVDMAASLDNGGYDITIHVGAGTFAARVLFRTFLGSGLIKIIGAGATSIIDPVASDTISVVYAANVLGTYQIQDFTIRYTGAGVAQALLYAYGGSKILFSGITFGAGAAWHIGAQFNGVCEAIGNYAITGAAASHVAAFTGGIININTWTITITGTPAFSVAFARAEFMSVMYLYSNTFSGAATGKRYQTAAAGGIRVLGAGINYLPGNVAGTTVAPGWYE